VVRVIATHQGIEALNAVRAVHRRGIQQHFLQHLKPRDLETLERMLENVRAHVRPLRPGRVSA
jgi:hypothetical protein